MFALLKRAYALAFGALVACAASWSPVPAASLQMPRAEDTRVGTDVAELSGPSSAIVFVDAMRQASPWQSVQPLRTDALGNVMSLGRGQIAESRVVSAQAYPAGDYTLTYDGAGSLVVAGATVVRAAPGRMVLRLRPSLGGIRVLLTSVDASKYPRNIRLILPGFEATAATQPFHPAYLKALQHFDVLRFAHWARADTYVASASWMNRATPTNFTQAGPSGAALEYQIALANATARDPWFTLPVGVTDYYIAQFAGLVRATLDPHLHATFEYGHEIWRPGTLENGYAQMAGSHFRLPGDARQAALEWYALRSAQAFAMVARTFGADAARITKVLSLPLGSAGSPEDAAAKLILSHGDGGASADALAVSGVVPGLIPNTSGSAPSDAARLQLAAMARAAQLARAHGLPLLAYDGPLDTSGVAPGVLAGAAQRVPAMREWYAGALEAWHAAGGGLYVTSGGDVPSWALAGIDRYVERHPSPHLAPVAHDFITPSLPRPVATRSLPRPALAASVPPARATFRTNLAVAGVPLYIDTGGGAATPYVADEYTTGTSYAYRNANTIDASQVYNPAPAAVYDSERYGKTFGYTIPNLTPGATYTLRLHFAEIYWSATGARVFNVAINGTPKLTNFDIVAAAGGANKAIVEPFTVTAQQNGQITIGFTTVRDNAKISGIEVQAGSGPTYINGGGGAAGNYLGDQFFSGANTAATQNAINVQGVQEPAPQAVYQSERYGNFTYTIPILTPNTPYTVLLHFAEFYWRSARQRVFNVAINGTPVLSNFDIVQAAGGANKAIVKSFATTSSGSGSVSIAFTTVVDNAKISGIEIQPGGSGSGGGPPPTPTPAPYDMTTFHNDGSRTGWNSNEAKLTVASVGSSSFAQLGKLQVDGTVLAQPLYLNQYQVPGAGTHNLVVVTTMHNSVYAFDADTLQQIWHVNLGASQSSNDVGCGDVQPEYGIGSTPVINRTGSGSGTLYLVAATEPSANNFHTQLHALDIGTGADQTTPVEISPSALQTNGSTIAFDPKNQWVRTGLVFANGSVYVGVGSHCDDNAGAITGWMLRYNTSLQLTSQFNTVDDSAGYSLASIWMTGQAADVDASGNLYFVTGNGAFDASSGGRNYGESVMKLSSDLKTVSSYFTPSNWNNLNGGDADFGSGGSMLLPGSTDLVARGKDGRIFLLNQNTLGGLQANDTGALQVYQDSGGTWGGPAYFAGPGGTRYVYYQGDGNPLRAFTFNGSQLTLASSASDSGGYGGSMPVVSSNAAVAGSGVVWIAQRSANVTLEAYDATNLQNRLFSGPAGTWSNPGNGNPFVTPLVVDGRVFVGAAGTVTVFGLH